MKVNLGRLDALPEGSSRGFRLQNASLFAVRSQDRVFVYLNRCPHLGVELEWTEHQFLNGDATLIQCASHGALFLIEDGLCVAGPCLGERLQPAPFQIEGGRIIVDLNDLSAE